MKMTKVRQKKLENIWKKIKYLIDSENSDSIDYDDKSIKVKFNLDNNLQL